MYKFGIAQRFFLVVFMLLSACENARVANNPKVKIDETSNSAVSYDETIHINNCGGKADSEQTVSRSFATSIEGGIEIGVQQIVEGSISAKYSQYRNTTKGMRLLAPPGANMEFVLRWSEQIRAGNVVVNGSTGTYEVHIPVGVEQVSSQDLGCLAHNPIIPTSIAQPTETQPLSTTRFLSLNTLKQVLNETSSERVEITLGKLREYCNQGVVICYDHPSSNWSILGPAIIGTDPLQQPINGAQVVKVNKDGAGNWLPNWPIGLFYVPAGKSILVPTPGVAYPLEDSLPSEWIIR